MPIRCNRCFELDIACHVLPPHKKCSECVRRGCRCERELVSEEEWLKLDRAKEKVKSDIQASEDSVSELSAQLDELSSSLFGAIAKLKRLKRSVDFLEGRESKFLRRDLEVLESLDEEKSSNSSDPSILDVADFLVPFDNIISLDFLGPPAVPAEETVESRPLLSPNAP
ncbi:hypothetical protein I7I53_08945 [Histoplasma capsulatum var. duboisii H88]|uniref:Zn(2)-C6 fungal-type domain-containing protein n=1 Tax=Ajellomyces capsulatus (strain H88) TaxID=544711 RepID=A0A8A1L389_AJEC8|nr:hypothetical protein I7I53_08945 [Histoplasma capsulatum var. duboisii H88]